MKRKETKMKTKAKKQDNPAKQNASQQDEAQAILAQMESNKDAGDCPFC
jgi:hypothetical protein